MQFEISQVEPQGDNILVRKEKIEEKKTAGGIIIPSHSAIKQEYILGTIIAVGPGKSYVTEEGKEIFQTNKSKEGWQVVLPLRVGLSFTHEQEDYILLREGETKAIIRQ